MKTVTVAGAMWLLLCAGGTRVEAQRVASSFDELGVLVRPGASRRAQAGEYDTFARTHVIYRKSSRGTRVSMSPLIGRGRRGAAVAVKF